VVRRKRVKNDSSNAQRLRPSDTNFRSYPLIVTPKGVFTANSGGPLARFPSDCQWVLRGMIAHPLATLVLEDSGRVRHCLQPTARGYNEG
jgi:hypothetical protein